MKVLIIKTLTIITLTIVFFLATTKNRNDNVNEIALNELNSYLVNQNEKAKYLGVVDYSLPSWKKRLTIINLETGHRENYLVAHAINSGDIYANRFSNEIGSNKSSLGLFQVGKTYTGIHGKSLRLHGLNKKSNSNAYTRAIVLHRVRL